MDKRDMYNRISRLLAIAYCNLSIKLATDLEELK